MFVSPHHPRYMVVNHFQSKVQELQSIIIKKNKEERLLAVFKLPNIVQKNIIKP